MENSFKTLVNDDSPKGEVSVHTRIEIASYDKETRRLTLGEKVYAIDEIVLKKSSDPICIKVFKKENNEFLAKIFYFNRSWLSFLIYIPIALVIGLVLLIGKKVIFASPVIIYMVVLVNYLPRILLIKQFNKIGLGI
jgi:hypothetical protein